MSEATARRGSSGVGMGSEALLRCVGACAFREAKSAAFGALKALGRCHAAPGDLRKTGMTLLPSGEQSVLAGVGLA